MQLEVFLTVNGGVDNIGAVIKVNDSDVTRPQAQFVHFRNVPGLGLGPPALHFDGPSNLYWMVNNVAALSRLRCAPGCPLLFCSGHMGHALASSPDVR